MGRVWGAASIAGDHPPILSGNVIGLKLVVSINLTFFNFKEGSSEYEK